ncbi:MAG: DUF4351 domain-containing protein [Deinococcales bacterium]
MPASSNTSNIDHDKLFKELLKTFFGEFIELFFPDLATFMDMSTLKPLSLDKDLVSNIFDGERFQTDLVMQAKFRRGAPHKNAQFLVHIEHQSTREANFPRRMFNYFSLLYANYDLPIYPIVIFSHNKKSPEADRFSMSFPNKQVLDFCYDVVQLSRYDWRDYMDTPNPVASALMAKMAIAKKDRPRVKLECLKLLSNLKLNPAKMKLISGFVDTYLKLNTEELVIFKRRLEEVDTPRKEKVMELTNSWTEEGRAEGIGIGKQELLLTMLGYKFKEFSESDQQIVRQLSLDNIEELAKVFINLNHYEDLQHYLNSKKLAEKN